MLKRYETDNRLQWSGKAWEIREALRQEKKRAGSKKLLVELLPQPHK